MHTFIAGQVSCVSSLPTGGLWSHHTRQLWSVPTSTQRRPPRSHVSAWGASSQGSLTYRAGKPPGQFPLENSMGKALIAFVSFIKSVRWEHALDLETMLSSPTHNNLQYGVFISRKESFLLCIETYFGDSFPPGINFPWSLPSVSFPCLSDA